MTERCNQTKKPVIGLTGTIGSGKTTVAGMLNDLGCAVIHADSLAHRVLEEDAGKEYLLTQFGSGVLDESGKVDRKRVADIVFSDPAKIRVLESFVHPEVIRRQAALVENLRADPSVRALVLEVPLLVESGLIRSCNWVILVDADISIRLERVARTRGWSREELVRREKFFFSIYLKRSLVDAIVYNNSTIEMCRQQVDLIYSRIISSVSCQLA